MKVAISALLLVAGTAIVAATAFTASPAAAHDALVESTPADGSTVSSNAENAVTFRFNNDVLSTAAFVAVIDPSGVEVSTADPVIAGHNVTRAYVPSDPGIYTASYRVTSSDGHPIEGSITFEHEGTPGGDDPAPAEERATTSPEASDNSEGSSQSNTVVVVLAVGAVAVMLAVVVIRRFRGRRA